MEKIYQNSAELIGKTPLMRADHLAKQYQLKANLFLKLEYFNPTGSVKDRAAKFMVEDAEKRGLLKPGGTIIEPTSGNTGIGLAALAAVKGYRAVFTMPETMSVERRNILKAYGAEIVLTEGSKGMKGAIAKAEELQESIPSSIIAGQFINQANVLAHEQTTGPEIWEDTDGKVDAFLAGVGTGGTITGTSNYLKKKNKSIHIVAIEPDTSPVLSEGKAGGHGIQGIGAGFIPSILDVKSYDEVMTVSLDESIKAAKELAHTEGVLVGISSGAALSAGIKLAQRPEFENKNIVILLPDSGDRYYSSPLFKED